MRYANGIFYNHATPEGRIGMFSALHCHNDFELIYVISGDMVHVIEGRKYLLKKGDLALVRPSTYHYLQRLSEEPYERHNIQFNPRRYGTAVSALPEDLEVISLLNNPIATGLFQKLDYYREGLEPDAFGKFLEQLLEELFLNLRIFSDTRKREETILSPILTRALTYINENLFTITDVDQIAQALYISPSYLFYLFRTSLHQTPKKYITDKRLLAAQRKICAGGKPTEVYKACGFRDYTTFYRSYTASLGHPPSQDSKHRDMSPL